MPVLEVLAGLAIAILAVWLVVDPVLHPPARPAARPSADEGMDAEEDDSPRARALGALKEIEFDRETGKLDEADYRALKTKYTRLAVAAMGQGAGSGERGAGSAAEGTAPRSLLPAPVCPACGPRPESDALFCSNCGRPLPAVTAA